MALFLGLDLGTSALKAVLVDDRQRVVDQESVALAVAQPQPQWSEQDPEAWWQACDRVLAAIALRQGRRMGEVAALGLAGQMHGAVLLDAAGAVIRPAILWNDGRAAAECAELERRAPRSRRITGNLAMPGFTAPKLLWVARHEPDAFARVARVLLPKDYLRWRLTGTFAIDVSDAAGTLWLDCAARRWSDEMLAATDLTAAQMPEVFEGSQPTGTVQSAWAQRWGLGPRVPVAGGGGDNAAGAVGVGAVAPGDCLLSLGTSGVLFAVTEGFAVNPEAAVHAFCHAVPGTWHQMAVMLSAAGALSWACRATGGAPETTLLAEAENTLAEDARGPLFLPYLSGERTPHNDADAMGVLLGLDHGSGRGAVALAVLEGVALGLAQGRDALAASGTTVARVQAIGGGARSPLWLRLIAAALETEVLAADAVEAGPAFGAARLARLAATGERVREVCVKPPPRQLIAPEPRIVARLARRRPLFAEAYARLRPLFPAMRGAGL